MKTETWQDRLEALEKRLENEVNEGKITKEEASKQYNKAYAEEYCEAHPFI